MGFFSINLIYALILSCGSMSFGTIIAFGSASLRIIKVVFGPLSTFYVGAFQSAPAFIAMFAPFFWNFLLKKISMKVCTSIVGLSGTVFWLLLLTMNKKYFWISIINRAFLGVTLAGCSTICPLYFTEIAPPDRKGFYGSFHVMLIIIGHIITNLLGVTHKWQLPVYVVSGFMFIFGTCVFFIPSKQTDANNEEQSKEILNSKDKIELNNINSEQDETSEQTTEIKKMGLFDKSILKQSIVSMTLLFLGQFSGIGSIMQNLSPLMSEVGLDFDPGYQATIAILAQLLSAFLSSILIDKYGFRILWNVSSGGTTLSLLLYGLNVKFNWSNWLPMIFLFCFQFFFGIGIGNIPWIAPTYVFPPELKSKALALGTSLNWFSATVTMFMFPYFQKWFGQFGLMMILSGTNLTCFIVGIFFVEDYNKKPKPTADEKHDDVKDALINGDQNFL